VRVNSSNTPNEFRITRHSDGTTQLRCSAAASDGCPTGGVWG
jgi:hypothetical protein